MQLLTSGPDKVSTDTIQRHLASLCEKEVRVFSESFTFQHLCWALRSLACEAQMAQSACIYQFMRPCLKAVQLVGNTTQPCLSRAPVQCSGRWCCVRSKLTLDA